MTFFFEQPIPFDSIWKGRFILVLNPVPVPIVVGGTEPSSLLTHRHSKDTTSPNDG